MTANHNIQIIVVACLLSTISALCVLTRLVSRTISKQRFTVDDFLLIAAFIIGLGETTMIAASVRFSHFGYHLKNLSRQDIVGLQKVMYASGFQQTTSLALAKIALLIFLYRMFNIVEGFRRACWIFGAIVVSWWITSFFGNAFICFPASILWAPESGGTCGNKYQLNLAIPIPWVITDLAILIAPIPVVRSLRLSGSQKIKVYAAFLIGSVTCVVSVLRFLIFVQLINKSDEDFSWNLVPISLGNIVEVQVTVMCPALMASGAFFSSAYTTLRSKWIMISPSSASNPDSLEEPNNTANSDTNSFSDFQTMPEFMLKWEEERTACPGNQVV